MNQDQSYQWWTVKVIGLSSGLTGSITELSISTHAVWNCPSLLVWASLLSLLYVTLLLLGWLTALVQTETVLILGAKRLKLHNSGDPSSLQDVSSSVRETWFPREAQGSCCVLLFIRARRKFTTIRASSFGCFQSHPFLASHVFRNTFPWTIFEGVFKSYFSVSQERTLKTNWLVWQMYVCNSPTSIKEQQTSFPELFYRTERSLMIPQQVKVSSYLLIYQWSGCRLFLIPFHITNREKWHPCLS